jgi:ABC-2 type transport system ATP-binding protein
VGRIGVVFGQRTQPWWDLPVIESFELLRDIYRVPQADFARRCDELFALLDLDPLLDVPVRQLSLGQRMRCDLVAALLHGPQLLFLDEPTVGLDAVSKLAVRDFIKRLNKKRGTTVILTTHDMVSTPSPAMSKVATSTAFCSDPAAPSCNWRARS